MAEIRDYTQACAAVPENPARNSGSVPRLCKDGSFQLGTDRRPVLASTSTLNRSPPNANALFVASRIATNPALASCHEIGLTPLLLVVIKEQGAGAGRLHGALYSRPCHCSRCWPVPSACPNRLNQPGSAGAACSAADTWPSTRYWPFFCKLAWISARNGPP